MNIEWKEYPPIEAWSFFCALHELLDRGPMSLRGTAESLGISASHVSEQLDKFEKFFQIERGTLIPRGHGVKLARTHTSKRAYQSARKILDALEQARGDPQFGEVPHETLRIGSADLFNLNVFPDVFLACQKKWGGKPIVDFVVSDEGEFLTKIQRLCHGGTDGFDLVADVGGVAEVSGVKSRLVEGLDLRVYLAIPPRPTRARLELKALRDLEGPIHGSALATIPLVHNRNNELSRRLPPPNRSRGGERLVVDAIGTVVRYVVEQNYAGVVVAWPGLLAQWRRQFNIKFVEFESEVRFPPFQVATYARTCEKRSSCLDDVIDGFHAFFATEAAQSS